MPEGTQISQIGALAWRYAEIALATPIGGSRAGSMTMGYGRAAGAPAVAAGLRSPDGR